MIKLVTERTKMIQTTLKDKNGEKAYKVDGRTTLTSLLTLIANDTSTALLLVNTGRTFLS